MDNSWENNGPPNQVSHGFDWTKFAIGIALLLLVLGIFGRGVYWLTQNEQKIEGWAREQAKADWSEAKRIIQKMQTEEGTIELYRSHPKLRKKFPAEQTFLTAVAAWRARLEPLPESIPPPESQRFGHRIGLGGGFAALSYKMNNGTWVSLSWDSPSTRLTRQIIDIEVF